MFIILFSLSLALAWEYHDAGVAVPAWALRGLEGQSLEPIPEAASALFRMRVPVIAGLLAFAIYTNDQILEVLAMPYQSGRREARPSPCCRLPGSGSRFGFGRASFPGSGRKRRRGETPRSSPMTTSPCVRRS